jgi:hypothetical protein
MAVPLDVEVCNQQDACSALESKANHCQKLEVKTASRVAGVAAPSLALEVNVACHDNPCNTREHWLFKRKQVSRPAMPTHVAPHPAANGPANHTR